MAYTPRESCPPWESYGLKLKPNLLTDLEKNECRVVEPCDRVQPPHKRHRVGLTFTPKPDGSEFVPGRTPEFYPDTYVVAPTPKEAEKTVKEHYKLKDGVYNFSTLTLED